MKILLAPDKFKGSLTAVQVCHSWKKGIQGSLPDAEIVSLPLADGGEGSLSIIQSLYHLEPIKVSVKNPLGKSIEAEFLMHHQLAFIEMAEASGLALLNHSERNPSLTSSFGTGQLIKAAMERGASRIVLFNGGSATQDAGLGMAEALGFQFLDKNNNRVEPIPVNFHAIQKVSDSHVVKGLSSVEFQIISDVSNTLCGEHGSTYTYALQKGAKQEDLPTLEEGMLHIKNVLEQYCGRNIGSEKGSGAAGGIGASALALLGGKIESGFDFISKQMGIESFVEKCDVVFTGEGRADLSSLQGKVVGKMAQLAHQYKKKLVVITGTVLNQEEVLSALQADFFATIDSLEPEKEKAIASAPDFLEKLATAAVRNLVSD